MDNTDYLIETFVKTQAGDPFRLFPFGKIVKGGKARFITPEFAAQFKLPHFKPAIKLGSHNEETPAGGHIVGLEVRADGLYAIPEWNEKGAQAMSDGAYKYHSPEVLFEGGFENPQTGGAINAPLIVGDALLHTPHLGEATALYSVETIKEIDMENVTVPASLWDKFTAFIDSRLNPPQPEKVVPEDYEATKIERDNFKAEAEKMKAEAERKTRLDKFEAELKETKAATDMAELLADLAPEKADAIMRQFRALSEQINVSALTQEKGAEGSGGSADPQAEFNAAVLALVNDKKINYTVAFEQAKISHADLFKAAFPK